jgi:hypothetical protein
MLLKTRELLQRVVRNRNISISLLKEKGGKSRLPV